jgi:3-hydroxyacyl-[acyl-carrier-protein] dehydratase
MSQPYHYPMLLQRADMAALLPHRGAIFVCETLCIEGPHQFHGTARWPQDNAIIQGHFPGLPIVPGVMLIESMAQFAGAGLLAGDPYVKTLPEDSIGYWLPCAIAGSSSRCCPSQRWNFSSSAVRLRPCWCR